MLSPRKTAPLLMLLLLQSCDLTEKDTGRIQPISLLSRGGWCFVEESCSVTFKDDGSGMVQASRGGASFSGSIGARSCDNLLRAIEGARFWECPSVVGGPAFDALEHVLKVERDTGSQK